MFGVRTGLEEVGLCLAGPLLLSCRPQVGLGTPLHPVVGPRLPILPRWWLFCTTFVAHNGPRMGRKRSEMELCENQPGVLEDVF